MKAESDRAIVLRTQPYRESSLLVHWLGQEHGLLHTVAKGVHRPHSPFQGRIDLFFLCRIQYRPGRRSELGTLTEIELLDAFPALRKNLQALRQAAWCARLADHLLEPGVALPPVFHSLEGVLSSLAHQGPHPSLILHFEVVLLRELGVLPHPSQTPLPQPVQKGLQTILSSPSPSPDSLPATLLRPLAQWLGRILSHQFHLPLSSRDQALGLSSLPSA